MSQVTEQRSSSAQPNIQDVFLNYARRDRLAVLIHLLDGRQFDGRIKNFDRFAVIVEVNGADQLVFKHAIATISTQRSVANYFAAHHS
ncbi:MAG TPA: RNA chaperone Hfq [Vicinamibacterales bacterium]